MRLVLQGVAVELGGCPIVAQADLVVETGEFVGLVGPNGCGKSTLLRSIYRALRPAAGLISLDGDDLWRLPAKETARRVAVVAQESPSDMDFTVEEVVALGRTPHKRPLDRDTDEDREICADALERVGMGGARERIYATLSGGEKQRVLVARALAQRSYLHLLDEPTNHLDIRYQLEILSLVRGLGHSTPVGSSPAARPTRCSPPSALLDASASASAPTHRRPRRTWRPWPLTSCRLGATDNLLHISLLYSRLA